MTATTRSARKTGKTSTGEFNDYSFPVVKIEGETRGLDGLADGDLVTVDDETFYFYSNDAGEGLYREMVAVDAGDNVVRTRKCPSSMAGITAPGMGSGELSKVGSDQAYWIS